MPLRTLVTLLLIAGCSTIQPYTPALSVSTEEARRLVVRCIEEQPPKLGISMVEVTPEKLYFGTEVASRDRLLLIKTTQRRGTTFYFDGLGRMTLRVGRSRSVVQVFDKNGAYRFRVLIGEESQAKRFMDAMAVLSLAAQQQNQRRSIGGADAGNGN